ncbi:hypothetical protein F4604DRAFT_1674202 [Suillus subluteus]|nr:hypothetical protein F4604DRAFT_1674202 [Suillus subluteus]
MIKGLVLQAANFRNQQLTSTNNAELFRVRAPRDGIDRFLVQRDATIEVTWSIPHGESLSSMVLERSVLGVVDRIKSANWLRSKAKVGLNKWFTKHWTVGEPGDQEDGANKNKFVLDVAIGRISYYLLFAALTRRSVSLHFYPVISREHFSLVPLTLGFASYIMIVIVTSYMGTPVY